MSSPEGNALTDEVIGKIGSDHKRAGMGLVWADREGVREAYSREAFIFSGLMVRVERTPVAIWMLSPTVLMWSSMGSWDSCNCLGPY